MTEGAQQMIWQPVLSSFLGPPSFSLYHSLASLSILRCYLRIFSFACLAFCLLVPCKIILVSPDDRETWMYHFSFFFTWQWPEDLQVAQWLVSSLVTWSWHVIPRIFLKHLISVACILFSRSAVSVHDSHAYRNMEMTRARISLIFDLSVMFLSFQMVFSLFNAADVQHTQRNQPPTPT